MANLSELSESKQWGAMLLGAVLLTVALFFTVYKAQAESNTKAQQDLDAKVRENAELETYRPKLAELDRQVANLKLRTGPAMLATGPRSRSNRSV